MCGATAVARGVVLAAICLGLGLIGVTPALGHTESPLSTVAVEAGPYSLRVAMYTDQPRAGQELPLVVAPTGSPAPSAIRVVARPGLGTNATPTRAC